MQNNLKTNVLKQFSTRTPVEILQNTDEQITVIRLKLFQGKDARGYTQQLLPEPACAGIEDWAVKFGLPNPNTISFQQLASNQAVINSLTLQIETRPKAPETILAIMRHNINEKQAMTAVMANNTGLARHGSETQKAQREQFHHVLKTVAGCPDLLAPKGVSRAELLQYERFTCERARAIAWDWVRNTSPDISLPDTELIVHDHEIQIQKSVVDHLERLMDNSLPWDKIIDTLPPPDKIKHLVLSNKPWGQFTQQEKLLFNETILKYSLPQIS